MTSTVYSCVLAEKPHFSAQVMIWAWTLTELAGVKPSELVVHAMPGSSAETQTTLSRLGADVVQVRPFHPDHPYCNKLVQLQTERLLQADIAVLCDTDLAFTRSIEDVMYGETIRAKIVDLPNPPLDTWREVIEKSGLDWPGVVDTTFGGGFTVDINFNGGLYIIPGNQFRVLAASWPRWADWLIARQNILPQKYRKHVDQMSFGLACHQAHLPVDPLSIDYNFPTHLGAASGELGTPAVLHYHSNVDSDHFLNSIGSKEVDTRIESVNRVIRECRRTNFDDVDSGSECSVSSHQYSQQ